MQPTVLDLNGVVAKVEWQLRRLLRGNINLLTITTRDIGLVRADASQLERIIIGLAMKARDAMPDGGTLTLATTNVVFDLAFARAHPGVRTGPHVMLSVTDTGTRTTEEIYAHLSPQIGGYVVADSASGRGTTVRIYLPRVIGAESALLENAAGDGVTSHD
ncbi:MAG TPA: hypothetical protein VGN73_11485 [Gemmatimonadaceae bacterium]|jgi:signal transduction histidine kinase|nr:hypothetical protein [Gemmatimonadaceae bacterium]